MDGKITISIVTITRGDGPLLKRAVESVYAQSLPDDVVLEHIVVDGNIEPGDPGVLTAEALGSKVLRVPPRGCYNAMNEGLDVASGQIVGLLHGTDFYAGTKVLSQVVETFRKSNCDLDRKSVV